MKKLAIVFFHMGVSPYQKYTLDLAVKRCPGSDVVLITDNPFSDYPDGIHVFDMNSYSYIVKGFDSIYVHKNTCPRIFNFRGILRWLIYNEWWKENPEYDLFVADSDVMIFGDMGELRKQWGGYTHTLSMGTAGGQSFWYNQRSMQGLITLIYHTYNNPEDDHTKKILGHYDNLQAKGLPGGVCDMTFLGNHVKLSVGKAGETTEVINGSTFDHNILMAQEYVFVNGRKVVEFKDGFPYCRTEADNIPIKFNTLHMSCSGGLIEEYYNKAMGG